MRIALKAAFLTTVAGLAVPAMAVIPTNGGPYNVRILAGGIGVERDSSGEVFAADSAFTISGWVKSTANSGTLFALGDPAKNCRCLNVDNGRLVFAATSGQVISSIPLRPDSWTHVAAVYDGQSVTIYLNGVVAGSGVMKLPSVANKIAVAPVVSGNEHFGGELVGMKVDGLALAAQDIMADYKKRPNFDVVHMWNVGKGWEWQNRANTGLWRPQDPWTLPISSVPATAPVSKPVPSMPDLSKSAFGRWQINNWTMIEAPKVKQDGAALSRPGAATNNWHKATVPGTVLQTLVDRGVYPDPYHALNNMVIPESLARQDYWYRTTFEVPSEAAGMQTEIIFNGVNYASEVWINGEKAGNIKGAFIRGRFAFTPVSGANVIAIKVSPPPNPGTPHEQSIKGGVGENGGQLAIDGPTFVATEGWDWIPAIRDRNTGLWQNVEFTATGALEIGDPQIITDLPLPRTDSADIYIHVPIINHNSSPIDATVKASFGNVAVERSVRVAPGSTVVKFSPATDSSLKVSNPQLWWPNGYGEPVLHTAKLSVETSGRISDSQDVRFGIREVSYDLGLFDSEGQLKRVQVQTTDGGLARQRLIDVTHEAIKESPKGWAASLTKAAEQSAAITPVTEYTIPEPHMAIRVNGVKIAARGGNWGMNDAMKRIARDRMEPYFRLQKDAHMNIIRNWMGNNTEPSFFDLADEYGMMVMQDFWQSTQNFQVEPQDPQLFLENARDAVARYRNHPSIIMWFGRNEGVPYPLLNKGLDDVVFDLDGTRWFTGSSNVVNLQGSGPYNYRPPEGYFTNLATGFSVETGTPSLSTIESIQSYTPQADQWPLSDTLAYHDWHFAGNGDTKTFMETLATMFGPATSLPDFERKAQMMNLETHKAMYEGLVAHLWTKNTGRLLWMTHPAWPSNAWQIYSWDYDTHAAYYGAKKATEPLHVQLNLPDNRLAVVNTTQSDSSSLRATTVVTDLAGKELFKRVDLVNAPANAVQNLPVVPLTNILSANPMVLVSLKLTDAQGGIVSDNFYWRGRDVAAYQALNDMPQVPLSVSLSRPQVDGKDKVLTAVVRNASATPALNAKLTLVDAKGKRILPAFYTDNYVALLPGESKTITIRYPASQQSTPKVTLRGWNVADAEVKAR
jgi:Exo-beta-D-glucosaminidase Ig-fold domain/Concanavalin A-like lectin/glucanases superfamily/Glycosyl hydrolases family 2/Glycosyl hydrolases family 2, sugar binding domain/Glycosyl hydrolases family 2, TIM barrel domain